MKQYGIYTRNCAGTTIYSFNELTDKAKVKAIEEHRNFQLSIMQPNDFISGEAEHDTPEELQKTYEAEYDYYLTNDEPIIENIEINDYMFFFDGTMANVTEYTGKHEKAGQIELKLYGEIYSLSK